MKTKLVVLMLLMGTSLATATHTGTDITLRLLLRRSLPMRRLIPIPAQDTHGLEAIGIPSDRDITGMQATGPGRHTTARVG